MAARDRRVFDLAAQLGVPIAVAMAGAMAGTLQPLSMCT